MHIEQLLTHEDKQVRELAKELSNFELPYRLNYVHNYNRYPKKIVISIGISQFTYIIEWYQEPIAIFSFRKTEFQINVYLEKKHITQKTVETKEEVFQYLRTFNGLNQE